MSNRRLDLTVDAQIDFRGILQYTYANWGEAQQIRYGRQLMTSMERLTDHPDLGMAGDDVPPGMRMLVVRQYVVYYRVDPEAITIIRILHQRLATGEQLD